MATAAGAAALLYYTLNRKLQSSTSPGEDDDEGTSLRNHPRLGIDRVSNRLIQAPATWLETISTLSETLRSTKGAYPSSCPLFLKVDRSVLGT
ncbi:Mono-/di-acylglycerol lipase, N-terminal [Trema orientale]|uniref:Mono-/di-acylglycerol lipase, N-terminal n=1 Tax=Trema orientale TaxID=63057 RepID=A0A2P5F8R3_TREOI|nr:Mono-/di-acylglycerol lipase, N-terminal [Trema orientale]